MEIVNSFILIGIMFAITACDKKTETAKQGAEIQQKAHNESMANDASVNQATDENNSDDESLKKDPDQLADAFKNRKIYTELNSEIIKTIKDNAVEQAIIDYVSLKLEDKSGDQVYETVIALPEGYVDVFATWELEAEVNNGGFDQYFFNTGGEFALEAIEGFKKMGADKMARLVKKALDKSLNEHLVDKLANKKDGNAEASNNSDKENDKENKQAAANYEALDELFYAEEELISPKRIKFIRENPDLF